ncbi:MAG: hypothetical protein ACLRWP_10910 [Bilophila wadsworthia]
MTLVESGNLGGTSPEQRLHPHQDAESLRRRAGAGLAPVPVRHHRAGAPAVDPAAVLARKEKVCSTLRGGLERLARASASGSSRGGGASSMPGWWKPPQPKARFPSRATA